MNPFFRGLIVALLLCAAFWLVVYAIIRMTS